MTDVIVIGGGAAGMIAAYGAALSGGSVLLLEKNEKLGKAITQLTGYQFPQTFKSDEEVRDMLQGVI